MYKQKKFCYVFEIKNVCDNILMSYMGAGVNEISPS